MKFSLRTLALGAAFLAVGAMTAQEAPTVTQKWITHDLVAKGFETGDVRSGSGLNGKAYISNGTSIMTYDGNTVETLYTHSGAINRGFALDEAGNIAIAAVWPTGASNWNQWILIKADGSEATPIELKAPESSDWVGARTDLVGRAVGDFFSEDGGLFFLTTQNMTYPIPVWITEGVQDEFEFATSATAFAAANNMAYANPRYPLSEISFDEAADAFWYESSNMAQIGYVNEDEEPAYVAWPEIEGLKGQNGFDCFELGGNTYAVHVFNATNWGSNFAIWNVETGEVIYQSEYSADFNGETTGNGCSFVARKVNDYKVELYQCYVAGGAFKANSFNALYEITIPEPQPQLPPLYLAGAVQGWDPANPIEFTLGEDGLYTLNYTQKNQSGFKISTAKGTWDDFNAAVLGVEGNLIAAGETYALVAGNDQNINILDGEYTFTVDLAANTLTVSGEAYAFEPPVLYLRGEFNGWGTSDDVKFAASEVSEEGNVTYTLSIESIAGEFKIGDESWGTNFGFGALPGAGTYNVFKDEANMTLPENLKNLKLTLVVNKDNLIAGTLTVAGTLYAPLNAFAYDVKGEMGENDVYTVTYKASENASEGEVVVKDAEGQTVLTSPLSNIVKGENTAVVDLSELAEGAYTWSVRLITYNENENVAVGYMSPNWTNNEACTGGVVFIRDTNSPAFGYRALSIGRAKGFAIYDQEMNLVGDKLWHVGYEKFNSGNGSSPTRGDALRNYAVFADWSDKASGYWRLDVLNPAEEPVNMLMSEGATMASSGAVTLNGVEIGSGSPAVAFRGEGENTQMFGFDEDVYGNTVVRYNIGEATYITEAPVFVSDMASKFANTNICIVAREDGYWVSQQRANIEDAGVPAIMYFDNENELIWTPVADEAIRESGATGSNSGIAISEDNSMLAFGDYSTMQIHLFLIQWEENSPNLIYLMSFDQVPAETGQARWAQMVFDSANNLMVYDRRVGRLVTYVLPGGALANTPAKAEYTINKTSGIEGITVGADNAPAEYFNLQGIRVDASNLTPGVYVRRQGDNATKVVIR